MDSKVWRVWLPACDIVVLELLHLIFLPNGDFSICLFFKLFYHCKKSGSSECGEWRLDEITHHLLNVCILEREFIQWSN